MVVHRGRQESRGARSGERSALDVYGIAGLPNDPRVAAGLPTQLINGYSDLGRQATNPQWQYPRVYNPKVNYSWLQGRHSLKTGYEFQHIQTEVQDVNPLYGRDEYFGNFTRPAGVAANNLYNLSDFMFGLRSRFGLSNILIANLRQNMHFTYLQDDWRVNDRLTLNLGLRYEYATPWVERDDILSNFDPATRTMVAARDGSLEDRALVKPDRNNWAPRLGFAWSVTPQTVVRGAYGISYIHFHRAGGANILLISDRGLDRDRAPIPALLAVAGLHHHLIRNGTRTRIGLVLESGEPREVHHFSLLIGYGVGAVNPYLAFETLDDMIRQGLLKGMSHKEACKNFVKAAVKGVIKVISKMGISTIQSYRGAQIFEAVGLHAVARLDGRPGELLGQPPRDVGRNDPPRQAAAQRLAQFVSLLEPRPADDHVDRLALEQQHAVAVRQAGDALAHLLHRAGRAERLPGPR